jgi:hypothetical protein
MDVLMPETSSTQAGVAAAALREAGHVVHTCCDPSATGFMCKGMHGNACPLETAAIDVALDVRSFALPIPRLAEEGVRCAARRHIPVVMAGAVAGNPFKPWTSAECSTEDVVATVEAAAASPLPDLSTRATEVLRTSLERMDFDPQDERVEVRRRAGRLAVRVIAKRTDDDPARDRALRLAALRVHQAIREFDKWGRGADVAIFVE